MRHLFLALPLAILANSVASAEPRVYELQKIQASPDKLDSLHVRLRDHQIPLLEKHGIKTVGVFTPAGGNPDRLVYVLVTADGLGDLTKGWADFAVDPAWKKVLDGERVVMQSTTQSLRTTSWSPLLKPETPSEPRVFELRTYTCPDHSKQTALTKRFREHTMVLFAKHGMINLIYWQPEDDDRMLVYLLAHKSQGAAKESFAAFRADPEWLAAKKASEEAAGGPLTEKENGVVSQFLEATEYSPLK